MVYGVVPSIDDCDTLRLAMTDAATLAFFGGSFDPPHVGHVLVAAYVLTTQPVQGVVVVPGGRHPFGKQYAASFEHRRRMCELAMQDLARVEVCDVEADPDSSGFTVDTLECLQQQRPEVRWRLVLGADLVDDLPRWKDYQRLLQLAPPIVVGRHGHPLPSEATLALPEVSSSDLRQRLGAGASTEGLIPQAVQHYIASHGLYAAGSTP